MAGSRRRARARGHGGHENHERWLLPYADMITLLLALFIMLYAMANVNNAKVAALQASIGDAFNGQLPVPESAPEPSEPSKSPLDGQGESLLNSGVDVTDITRAIRDAELRKQETESLNRIKQRIDNYARTRHMQDKISTRIDERGLVIRLVTDKVLFNTGEARLRPDARPLLGSINRMIGDIPNHVRVEGHTDSVPIHTAMFPSNWELSTTRAATVVRHLIARGRDENRMSAAGYGDRRPIDTNRTEAGRGRNRRVEIVIVRRTA